MLENTAKTLLAEALDKGKNGVPESVSNLQLRLHLRLRQELCKARFYLLHFLQQLTLLLFALFLVNGVLVLLRNGRSDKLHISHRHSSIEICLIDGSTDCVKVHIF